MFNILKGRRRRQKSKRRLQEGARCSGWPGRRPRPGDAPPAQKHTSHPRKAGRSQHFPFYASEKNVNPLSLHFKISKAILTHFSSTIFLICDLLLQLLHGPKWAAFSGCHSGRMFVKVTRFFIHL